MISYKINYNLIKEGEKIMAELMASNFVHNAIDEDLKVMGFDKDYYIV